MWLVKRQNPKGKGKKKKAEETYKHQRMTEWIKEQEFLRNEFNVRNKYQEALNQGWNNWNNQAHWVYPVRPSVRRTYVRNGVYLTNFPYDHKYPKIERKHEKVEEPSGSREPYRPVLYVKKNKVVTEYRPPVNLHVNSATVEDSTQVDDLPFLEASDKKISKKDENRGNIFSVLNWFSNKPKPIPNIKLGTDIVSALKEKNKKIRPLEAPLKIRNSNEMTNRRIAKMKVREKEKKKHLDKNTIKKFNKLQEQTFTFQDAQNNGVYKITRKSALKDKSQPNRNRKLSWDKSIPEKENKSDNVKEIFKAEDDDLRESSNRLVNIGSVYIGNPYNERSPEPEYFETTDEENEKNPYSDVNSQSIANVSSVEIGHFEPKFDRDRYLENAGTKIISDTVSEIIERAVRKKETENKSSKTKGKKVIKLEAERIDDKILIKRRVKSYKDGKEKNTDVLYYMDVDKSLDLPNQVDPVEKEQEEKLLYFLRKWANGDVNVVFVKKEDLSAGNLEYDDDDTLIIVNDKNRMIRVKSVVLGKENLDYAIKDPKWIHIMNDIISYRRGHLMGKRIESTPYRKEILNY